jgi:epoxyqueuosine reductase
MRVDDWHEMTEEVFKSVFKKSAVKRSGYEGVLRNAQAAFPKK